MAKTVTDPFRNLSGWSIKPHYGPKDVAGLDPERDLGPPGEHPFTRGVHATMYRGKPWTIRQLGSLGAPAEANQRIRQLTGMGATGVSICFDMPTIMGLDSDDPLAEGEVGSCCGVAIDTLEDMRLLLQGIPLGEISINLVSNSQSAVILAMFAAAAEEQGTALQDLTGTLQNDVLKEYQAQKSFYFPPRPSLRLTVDTIRFCMEHLPRFNPISISGYHLASAGATPVQELAFTLANAFTYLEAVVDSGLSVDQFAPRLSFFFKAHNDFFENIAKLRAARRIWARALRERYGARDPRSCRLRTHMQTSGSSLTAQQPENNLIRVTLQALSAVLAGTQSLHTNAFDEALSVPTPRSERLALRTQQIIAHESGVMSTADPLGGSYYVEALTDRMESESLAFLKEIQDRGGVVAAIEEGYFQRLIAESAFRYQREVEQGERVIVGLNAYADEEEPDIELREADPDFERRKVARLQAFRQERDPRQAEQAIRAIAQACRGNSNVMPVLIRAVKAGVTLGESIAAMREVFGEFRETSLF